MRYLTPKAKSEIITEWENRINHAPRTNQTEGCLGGHGGVDTPMINVCAQINMLPGIVTLQSCMGHVFESYIYPGQLWLWFDESRARLAYESIEELIFDGYEQPHLMWQSDGQEILDVRWAPQLEPSIETALLIDWLKNL